MISLRRTFWTDAPGLVSALELVGLMQIGLGEIPGIALMGTTNFGADTAARIGTRSVVSQTICVSRGKRDRGLTIATAAVGDPQARTGRSWESSSPKWQMEQNLIA